MAKNNGTLGEAEAELGDKALDLSKIVQRSVQQTADGQGLAPGGGEGFQMIWMASQQADGMTPWGRLPKRRDRELRDFWITETYLAGAMGSVVARNAAYQWKITGGEETAKQVTRNLKLSQYGRGFPHLQSKLSLDLYSQDSGAFLQFIREDNARPESPILNITHLDAWRMFPTGVPEEPYVYYDRKGVYHRLKWWQVYNVMELPAPVENMQGGPFYELQYCAVTLVLRAAQILRNIAIYKDEKTAGRFLRAVHIISGISQEGLQDAIEHQKLASDQSGALRHIQPLMVTTLDPNAKVSVATLELASLPDGFDEEKTMEGYVMALALGFKTDYQEFAPLPGGGLGTASQSETQHQKSRGKGAAIYKAVIAHVLNEFVLPENVQFEWDEQDLEAEAAAAATGLIRVQTRAAQVISGEIDQEAATAMAVEAGDVPEELVAEIEGRRAQRRLEESERLAEQAQMAQQARPGAPSTNGTKPPQNPGGQGNPKPANPGKALDWLVEGIAEALTEDVKDAEWAATLGDFLQSRIHRAFTVAADDLYGMGYMDTDGRILLSSLIGDALRHFSEAMDADAAGIALQLLAAEDVEHLIKAVGAIGAAGRKDSLDSLPPSRRKLERMATGKFTDALDTAYNRVIDRMRLLQGDDNDKAYMGPTATEPKRKRPKRTKQTQKVHRASDGRIDTVSTETVEVEG